MATKKFYGVKNGRRTGIFNSWDECKEQVIGYPGAIYKGFVTEEEARNFVYERTESAQTVAPQSTLNNECANNCVIAYVDGSYDESTDTYSYGVCILHNNQEVHLSGTGNDAEASKMRNVAGEIMGAMVALKYAKEHGINKITIYHDYQGISSWALGEWKTNKSCTKAYKDFCDRMRAHVDFNFCKVAGHTGVFYNELVDGLAKNAIGVGTVKKSIQEHIDNIAKKK